MARQPDGPPPPPTVQKLRIRYAKRGRLRFASHRDLARTLERALRRAQVPMAFSAGFSPHPKISYLGAAPTGAASEAEYLEIGLAGPLRPRGGAGRPGRRAARRTSPSWSASRRARAPARWPTGSTPPSGGSSCPA